MVAPVADKHIRDLQTAIRICGQSVGVYDAAGTTIARTIQARVHKLSSEELANCAEAYNYRVTVGLQDMPTEPERGQLLMVDRVRRGIVDFHAERVSDLQWGWSLMVKG